MSKLVLIPSPIGNLEDITIRAIETIKNVDLILCEDTRRTIKLLNHLGIKKKLKSLIVQNYNRLLIDYDIIKIKDVDTKKINDYNNIFLVIDRIIVNGSKQFFNILDI